MTQFFSPRLLSLKNAAEAVTARSIAPNAERVDRDYIWPAHSMDALAQAGLMGLQVPEHLGGHGQGLLALAVIAETIGQACPSSALCFGMHCVGTAVIAAKATAYQQQKYLRAIAKGEHITTLALSESGTGAHFYLPETSLTAQGEHYRIDGTKQFVTNGGFAHSYVVSAVAGGGMAEKGDFSCVVVDHDTQGLEWLQPWRGFGMHGNSSRALAMHGAVLPKTQLLGDEGDQVWYVFEVVAPFFLMAMAGTYLGIAQAALDAAGEHLRSRKFSHSGETLRDFETLQTRYADMWIGVEKTRSLVHEAARRGDLGDPEALPFILACKADAGETAVRLANDAMTICGGMAYAENSRISQMLRDARASHVMSPTTDLLKIWTGRALLGLPLL